MMAKYSIKSTLKIASLIMLLIQKDLGLKSRNFRAFKRIVWRRIGLKILFRYMAMV